VCSAWGVSVTEAECQDWRKTQSCIEHTANGPLQSLVGLRGYVIFGTSDKLIPSPIPSCSPSWSTHASPPQTDRPTTYCPTLHSPFPRYWEPLVAHAGYTRGIQNGLYATLECQRSGQIDHERECYGYRGVSDPCRFRLDAKLKRECTCRGCFFAT